MIFKFQIGLRSLLRQVLLEPGSYGDLVYKLKKIVGSDNYSAQLIKIISHYKKIGYNIYVLQQIACFKANPIMVGNFAFLFNLSCLNFNVRNCRDVAYAFMQTFFLKKGSIYKKIDTDEMSNNAASHQGLCYMPYKANFW